MSLTIKVKTIIIICYYYKVYFIGINASFKKLWSRIATGFFSKLTLEGPIQRPKGHLLSASPLPASPLFWARSICIRMNSTLRLASCNICWASAYSFLSLDGPLLYMSIIFSAPCFTCKKKHGIGKVGGWFPENSKSKIWCPVFRIYLKFRNELKFTVDTVILLTISIFYKTYAYEKFWN